jgi:hypothetical protein
MNMHRLIDSEQRQSVAAANTVFVCFRPSLHTLDSVEVLDDALPPDTEFSLCSLPRSCYSLCSLPKRREEWMIRPEQHAPAAERAIRHDTRCRAALIAVCPRNDIGHEAELLRPVRDRIEVEPAEIVPRVVLQARLHGGVVRDAGREARGELRERAARVCEQEAERGVSVEYTAEDEPCCGLCSGQGVWPTTGPEMSLTMAVSNGNPSARGSTCPDCQMSTK